MMARLDDLPYEILIDICSLLCCTDLASTSRTSRQLRAASESLLYRRPRVLISYNDPMPRNLHIFLRTLLTAGCESLASRVRSLTLQWDELHNDSSSNNNPGEIPQPECDIALFTAAASRLGLTLPQTLESMQVVLLLHLLPRLEVLEITPSNTRDAFGKFMEAQNDVQNVKMLPPGLQSLREFSCCWTGSNRGVSPRTLRALMRLPSIRIILVHLADEIDLPVIMADADATSTVTDLRLSNTVISTSSLALILRIPRALRHFSYSVTADRGFDLRRFGEAFMAQQSSLQSLWLDFQDATIDGNIPIYPIGSLRDWPMLTSVRCSLVVLLGTRLHPPQLLHDVLPANIRELEILSDRYWPMPQAVGQLLLFLEHKAVVAPNLVRVAVRRECWKTPEMREALTKACEAANVELVDTNLCWFPKYTF